MPLVHPVVAMTSVALFVPVRTGDGQITGFLPTEGAPQGAPKGRIKESFLDRDQKGRVIVRTGPRRVFVVGSGVDRGYTVSAVQVVPPSTALFTASWIVIGGLPWCRKGTQVQSSHIEPASQDECLAPGAGESVAQARRGRGWRVIPSLTCDRPCPWDQAMWPYHFPLPSL